MRDFTREVIGVRGVYALTAEDVDVLAFHARRGNEARTEAALDMVGASRHETLQRLGTRTTQTPERIREATASTLRLLEAGVIRDGIHLVY